MSAVRHGFIAIFLVTLGASSLLMREIEAREKSNTTYFKSFRTRQLIRVFPKSHALGYRDRPLVHASQFRESQGGPSKYRALAPKSIEGSSGGGSLSEDLILLDGYRSIAIDEKGKIYEVNPSLVKDASRIETDSIRQPLNLSKDGKILGGAYGGLLPNTLNEIETFNQPSETARPAF